MAVTPQKVDSVCRSDDGACSLCSQDEVRSSVDDWSALGMRGNQSSPVVCEGVLTADRLIGSFGE